MPDGSLASEDLGRLMQALRPRLHRYCARMMGSAFDGEDVVQEALLKAAEAWPGAGLVERPENWLFRIAHNAALDALRRRRSRPVGSLDADLSQLEDHMAAADVRVAAAASLAAFLRLAPAQRACVVLMDVLGHSTAETGSILEMTEAAVKAALHRGRAGLRAAIETDEAEPRGMEAAERERLRAYADRFNARDFDALRSLLAEDVRLDLVNRTRLAGRKDVSIYFTRYGESHDWRISVGLAEGRPALLVADPADPQGAVRYVVLLDWEDGRIAAIRDFRYADYVTDDLEIAPV